MFPMTFLYGRTMGKLGLYIETIVSLYIVVIIINYHSYLNFWSENIGGFGTRVCVCGGVCVGVGLLSQNVPKYT